MKIKTNQLVAATIVILALQSNNNNGKTARKSVCRALKKRQVVCKQAVRAWNGGLRGRKGTPGNSAPYDVSLWQSDSGSGTALRIVFGEKSAFWLQFVCLRRSRCCWLVGRHAPDAQVLRSLPSLLLLSARSLPPLTR